MVMVRFQIFRWLKPLHHLAQFFKVMSRPFFFFFQYLTISTRFQNSNQGFQCTKWCTSFNNTDELARKQSKLYQWLCFEVYEVQITIYFLLRVFKFSCTNLFFSQILPFHPVELLACGVWLITIKQENFLRYIEILLPIMSNLDGLFCNFSTITLFFLPRYVFSWLV